MSLDFQKILFRFVILFVLVFGAVFSVMESRSPGYRGVTALALFPTSELTAQQMETVTENVRVVLQSDVFQDNILNALYENTEEWKRFSLQVKNPAGSVFELSYSDDSVDPYAVSEMLGIVRSEAVLAISRNYDLSRDLSVRFLDRGKVVESGFLMKNMVTALAIAFLIAGGISYVFFWRFQQRAEQGFRLAVKGKLVRGGEIEKKWWEKNPEIDSLETLEIPVSEEEMYLSLSNGQQKELPSEAPATDQPKKKTEPMTVVFKDTNVLQKPIRSASATGFAPANLPIATEMPEILKSYVSAEAKQETEEEALPEDETMLSESPAVNPEPSVEELKERLNKLLRGEMG